MSRKKQKQLIRNLVAAVIVIAGAFSAYQKTSAPSSTGNSGISAFTMESGGKEYRIPAYSGKSYTNVGNPSFAKSDFTQTHYIRLTSLDERGRCGAAMMNAYYRSLPSGKRGSIGMVKPTGWHTYHFGSEVIGDSPYLYNRCHLLMWAVSGLNAEKRNLITGTRSLNIDGQLPNETKILNYVRSSHQHVLYRVTPYFRGNNLLADGVLMEAESVEDHGKGLKLCVFAYNVQKGVDIDYSSGEAQVIRTGTTTGKGKRNQ